MTKTVKRVLLAGMAGLMLFGCSDSGGNGVWDCDDNLTGIRGEEPHEADPNCCPLVQKRSDGVCLDIFGKIVGASQEVIRVCPRPAKETPDACQSKADILKCSLE